MTSLVSKVVKSIETQRVTATEERKQIVVYLEPESLPLFADLLVLRLAAAGYHDILTLADAENYMDRVLGPGALRVRAQPMPYLLSIDKGYSVYGTGYCVLFSDRVRTNNTRLSTFSFVFDFVWKLVLLALVAYLALS